MAGRMNMSPQFLDSEPSEIVKKKGCFIWSQNLLKKWLWRNVFLKT
jgi:hypothetical protein